jgi:hypothetical protein
MLCCMLLSHIHFLCIEKTELNTSPAENRNYWTSVFHLPKTTMKPQNPSFSTPKNEYKIATYIIAQHNIGNWINITMTCIYEF